MQGLNLDSWSFRMNQQKNDQIYLTSRNWISVLWSCYDFICVCVCVWAHAREISEPSEQN